MIEGQYNYLTSGEPSSLRVRILVALYLLKNGYSEKDVIAFESRGRMYELALSAAKYDALLLDELLDFVNTTVELGAK